MSFDFEIILRLLLSAMLGGAIGLQREQLNLGAGIRTHALVSTASALVMIVSAFGFTHILVPGSVVLDPSRMAAQVVSGVGFLGAGIIIFRKNAVRGLTTAASIWAVAAIGLACGVGLYVAAVAAAVILSVILSTLKVVETKLFPEKSINRLTVDLAFQPGCVGAVVAKFEGNGLRLLHMSAKSSSKPGNLTLKLEALANQTLFASVVEEIQNLKGVQSVAYSGEALAADNPGAALTEDEVQTSEI